MFADIHDLKENVKNSDNFMLLLTEGVFERRFVIEEITTALELKKNIILVWDKERCPWPDANKVLHSYFFLTSGDSRELEKRSADSSHHLERRERF